MATLIRSSKQQEKPSLNLGGHIPIVEKHVEKEVVKIVEVVVPQIQERIVHVQVPVEKLVEVLVPQKVEVFVDREVKVPVEVVREVEKIVHVPVEVEKIITKEVAIELPVIKEVLVYKKDLISIVVASVLALVAGFLVGRI